MIFRGLQIPRPFRNRWCFRRAWLQKKATHASTVLRVSEREGERYQIFRSIKSGNHTATAAIEQPRIAVATKTIRSQVRVALLYANLRRTKTVSDMPSGKKACDWNVYTSGKEYVLFFLPLLHFLKLPLIKKLGIKDLSIIVLYF